MRKLRDIVERVSLQELTGQVGPGETSPKPTAGDEKKFVAFHKTKRHPDPYGNDYTKGVKTVDRGSEDHGHGPQGHGPHEDDHDVSFSPKNEELDESRKSGKAGKIYDTKKDKKNWAYSSDGTPIYLPRENMKYDKKKKEVKEGKTYRRDDEDTKKYKKLKGYHRKDKRDQVDEEIEVYLEYLGTLDDAEIDNELEQLDEISKKTLVRYMHRGGESIGKIKAAREKIRGDSTPDHYPPSGTGEKAHAAYSKVSDATSERRRALSGLDDVYRAKESKRERGLWHAGERLQGKFATAGDRKEVTKVRTRINRRGREVQEPYKAWQFTAKKYHAEETEPLDEISKYTLKRYISKAASDMDFFGGIKAKKHPGGKEWMKAAHETKKRETGISRAADRLGGEMEYKAFRTKSPRRGKGYISQWRTKAYTAEETQLDELKKSTLASYAKKAKEDMRWSDMERIRRGDQLPTYKWDSDPQLKYARRKSMNRSRGIDKAVDRLAGRMYPEHPKHLADGEWRKVKKDYHAEETINEGEGGYIRHVKVHPDTIKKWNLHSVDKPGEYGDTKTFDHKGHRFSVYQRDYHNGEYLYSVRSKNSPKTKPHHVDRFAKRLGEFD